MPIRELGQEDQFIIQQADLLISQLGADVSKAPRSSMRSYGCRQAADAYERLAVAQNLIERTVWERETVDGRNGDEIMSRLWIVRDKLCKPEKVVKESL
jgi:hypothetical protein